MSTLDIYTEKVRKEGRMEAGAEKDFNFLKNLLLTERLSTAEIASLAALTEAFVLQVKRSDSLYGFLSNY